MPQKRISRARKRDLERPDEFITFSARLLNTFNTYWKPISAGFAVVLVLLAGVLVYGHFRQKAEERAMYLLNQAMNHYAEELGRQDAEKALAAVAPAFGSLLADYGERQAGAVAQVFLAQMNFRAGHMEEAAALYEAALGRFPENSYGSSAVWNGLGYVRAAAGEYEKAVVAFSNVVSGADPVFKADALYQMALLYRKTGQEEAYRQATATLKNDYPDFIYAEVLSSSPDGG